jgi:hypothetical protein
VKVRIAIAALAIPMLAGCSAQPEPSPTPTDDALPVIENGTVVATGEFDSAEGTTGSVEFVKSPRGYEVRFTGFSTTVEGDRWGLMLSPYPLDGDRRCLDGFAIGLGIAEGPDFTVQLGEFDHFDGVGDPSFLDGVIVGMLVEQDRIDFDCHRSILARAPFTWDMPDLRPGLVVSDSGSTDGATGEVVKEAGTLASYTVAEGDVIEEVAARFGITVEDIGYLNPTRGTGQAETDEIINLDRTNRNGP